MLSECNFLVSHSAAWAVCLELGSDFLSVGKQSVKTKHILSKGMTFRCCWWNLFSTQNVAVCIANHIENNRKWYSQIFIFAQEWTYFINSDLNLVVSYSAEATPLHLRILQTIQNIFYGSLLVLIKTIGAMRQDRSSLKTVRSLSAMWQMTGTTLPPSHILMPSYTTTGICI